MRLGCGKGNLLGRLVFESVLKVAGKWRFGVIPCRLRRIERGGDGVERGEPSGL